MIVHGADCRIRHKRFLGHPHFFGDRSCLLFANAIGGADGELRLQRFRLQSSAGCAIPQTPLHGMKSMIGQQILGWSGGIRRAQGRSQVNGVYGADRMRLGFNGRLHRATPPLNRWAI